jgi:hypothetical protein
MPVPGLLWYALDPIDNAQRNFGTVRKDGEAEVQMFEKILQLLRLHCPHKNMSHPFAAATAARSSSSSEWESVSPSAGGHYVVCLDCGKKFSYDWNNMRIVS